SDASLRGRLLVLRRVSLLGELTQKLGTAPIYDFVSGGETNHAYNLRYFTLPEQQRYTRGRFAIQVDPTSSIEGLGWAATTLVDGSRPPDDLWPARTGYDASFVELGGSADWRPGLGLTLLAGYRLRLYDRPPPGVDSRLDDPVSAGERRTQE